MSEFVLHQEHGVIEAISRSAGAGGVITTAIFDGSIEIDLDGADVRNMCGVRAYIDGDVVSDEQYAWLEQLTQVQRIEIETALLGGVRRRIGTHHSRGFRRSIPEFDVDQNTSSLVFALDWCERNPNSTRRPLFELLGAVAVKRAGIWTPSQREITYEELRSCLMSQDMAGVSQAGRSMLLEALEYAVDFKIIQDINAEKLRSDFTGWFYETIIEHTLFQKSNYAEVSLSYAPADLDATVFDMKSQSLKKQDDNVRVWEGSAFYKDIRWEWLDSSNLSVSVKPQPNTAESWWVRCFTLDGQVLLSAAVIKDVTGDATALLLVQRQDVLLDIARSVNAPRLSERAARGQDAIAHGRSAGVAERVGDTLRAEQSWRACQRSYEAAGDLQRAKLAGARNIQLYDISEPLISDYLL